MKHSCVYTRLFVFNILYTATVRGFHCAQGNYILPFPRNPSIGRVKYRFEFILSTLSAYPNNSRKASSTRLTGTTSIPFVAVCSKDLTLPSGIRMRLKPSFAASDTR